MSRSVILMIAFVALSLVLAGCEQKPGSTSADQSKAAAPRENREEHDHTADDGHDHDQHAGHQHGDEGEHDHGDALKLGSREAGEYRVTVAQFGPASHDAAELVFEIELDGAQPPEAVRVLVRNSEGAESLKVKANKVGDSTYDVHVGELPEDLGAGGTVVVELESASATEPVEFAIKS